MNLATVVARAEPARRGGSRAAEVLKLEPRHLLALLKKAELLESRGKHKAAATGLSPRAADHLAQHAPAECAARPADSRARGGAQQRCGTRRACRDRACATCARHSAPRNSIAPNMVSRPSSAPGASTTRSRRFLHVPKLPAYEFYRARGFSLAGRVRSGHRARSAPSASACCARTRRSIVPYIDYPEGVPLDQWAELNKSRRWSAFFLWRDGQRVEANADALPEDRRIAGARTGGRRSRVMRLRHSFPILDAKSHIPAAHRRHQFAPHRAPAAGGATAVPLPGGLGNSRVARGQAWVFDDTIEHEAWNDSDVPRAHTHIRHLASRADPRRARADPNGCAGHQGLLSRRSRDFREAKAENQTVKNHDRGRPGRRIPVLARWVMPPRRFRKPCAPASRCAGISRGWPVTTGPWPTSNRARQPRRPPPPRICSAPVPTMAPESENPRGRRARGTQADQRHRGFPEPHSERTGRRWPSTMSRCGASRTATPC